MSLVYGYANPPLQKVLLELCFSDESHEAAFRHPRLSQVDDALRRDTLSGEQLRVLPMLYRLLPIDQMSAESRTKILNMYKHTFCRNNLLLHRLGEVQDSFRRAEFNPMIGLKGLPAIAYFRQGIGARPMADVDALIPGMQERPQEASAILNRMGYQIKASGFRCLTLISPEGLELDLHWYVHDWALGQRLVDIVQASSQSHILSNQSFLLPCVEHHVAHTLAHGVLTNTLTWDARWVFDVVGVLRQHPDIQAEKFAEFANQVAAPELLREGLAALANDLPPSVSIDRGQLLRLRDALKTNSKVVSWLYRLSPTPNVEMENRSPVSRIDRMKGMLRGYVLMPAWLRRHHNLSFLEYWRWVGQFPPDSGARTAWRFFRKLVVRTPVFLFRVVVGR